MKFPTEVITLQYYILLTTTETLKCQKELKFLTLLQYYILLTTTETLYYKFQPFLNFSLQYYILLTTTETKELQKSQDQQCRFNTTFF